MAATSGYSAAERLQRALRAAQGEHLVERAVAAGLITAEEVEAIRRAEESAGQARPLTEALVAHGRLDRAALARLEESDAVVEFARPSSAAAAPLPPDAEAAAAQPDRHLADFVLVELLGRGGTGDVWKAWDRRLGRYVAVKISVAALESASARARFEREALAAARLDHPHILPVYQVGSEGQRSFLVMPYIEGETLERARPPVPRALAILRDVAAAVEHAHRHGIVHRDLKPGNIMIDRAGRVFVLDFGLAFLREEASSRLTRPGEVVGTASYMAPEQARGDRQTAETAVDVYGLGATLYYLATGRAPFVGPSFAAVVGQVMSADPDPPHALAPDIDRRIEAVALKAMQKDPQRRYPSAGAFREELEKILAGEKVDARPPGAAHRARKLARQKAPVLAAVVASVALAAMGLARWREHRERGAAVETLREMARLSLETALRLRRAGDTAGMRQVLPQVEAAYRRVAERGAPSADVEYLMGRMHRALLDEERALAHQERALTRDPNFAPALYERAVLQSFRYGREVDQAVTELKAERPGARVSVEIAESARPELVRLRELILADAMRLGALPLEATSAEAVRGILAYHRRQLEDARARLERVVRVEPLREEAWETWARATVAAGHAAEAEQVYSRALAIDRGYAPLYAGRCELIRGRKPDEALRDAEMGLSLDPGSTALRLCRGGVLTGAGHALLMSGRDPTEPFAKAEADFDALLQRSADPHVLWSRGTVRRYRAIYVTRRARNPTVHLDGSEKDFTRALTMQPDRADHWSNRGRTLTRRALYLLERGGEPEPDLRRAIADFEKAIRISGAAGNGWLWRADALATLGRIAVAQRRWLDAERLFDEAEGDFDKARSDRFETRWVYVLRGSMRYWRGRGRVDAGRDPIPAWSEAEDDLNRAIQAFPTYTDSFADRALLRLDRGAWLATRGRPARADRDAGALDVERALAIEADHPGARIARTRLRALTGDAPGALAELRALFAERPGLARDFAADLAALEGRARRGASSQRAVTAQRP